MFLFLQRSRNGQRGFTLAELVVASTLISIVMAAVYTALSSTLRVSELGEDNLHIYQDIRNAVAALNREVNCIMSGADYLFQGKDDRFEFFAVTPPLDVEEEKGARVLWVQYRFNRSTRKVYREEANVEGPLPLMRPGEDSVDPGRIKLGRKHKFEFVSNVRKFQVEYFWIRNVNRKPEEPPAYIEPIVLKEQREGWGLPKGIRVTITVEDPSAASGRTTFVTMIAFQCPTATYDPKHMGLAEDQKS